MLAVRQYIRAQTKKSFSRLNGTRLHVYRKGGVAFGRLFIAKSYIISSTAKYEKAVSACTLFTKNLKKNKPNLSNLAPINACCYLGTNSAECYNADNLKPDRYYLINFLRCL
jgi:hypothetical protein